MGSANVIIVMFDIFQYYGDRVLSPEFVIEILTWRHH